MTPSERPTLEPVAAENIGAGDMLKEFNQALGNILADVHARRDILKKRKVTLSVTVEPKAQQPGDLGLDILALDYQISTAVPSRLGNRQDALVQADPGTGALAVLVKVDPNFPANDPRQSTILDLQQKETA